MFALKTWAWSELLALFEQSKTGEVWIFADGADFPYKFRGVKDVEELMRAVFYVTYKDNVSRGVYTNAAKYGYCVYCHGQDKRVRHWWELPNKIKFRGYRRHDV